MERCTEHPSIVDKIEKVQVTMAKVEETTRNTERAIIQVMDELKTRKLTPLVTWVIGIMAGIIGSMTMFILEHLGNEIP